MTHHLSSPLARSSPISVVHRTLLKHPEQDTCGASPPETLTRLEPVRANLSVCLHLPQRHRLTALRQKRGRLDRPWSTQWPYARHRAVPPERAPAALMFLQVRRRPLVNSANENAVWGLQCHKPDSDGAFQPDVGGVVPEPAIERPSPFASLVCGHLRQPCPVCSAVVVCPLDECSTKTLCAFGFGDP